MGDCNIVCLLYFFVSAAGQLPVSRVESVPGFQMHSEDFPALSKPGGKAHRYMQLALYLSLPCLSSQSLVVRRIPTCS